MGCLYKASDYFAISFSINVENVLTLFGLCVFLKYIAINPMLTWLTGS